MKNNINTLINLRNISKITAILNLKIKNIRFDKREYSRSAKTLFNTNSIHHTKKEISDHNLYKAVWGILR